MAQQVSHPSLALTGGVTNAGAQIVGGPVALALSVVMLHDQEAHLRAGLPSSTALAKSGSNTTARNCRFDRHGLVDLDGCRGLIGVWFLTVAAC